jgi:hypothetical protein
VGGAQGGDGLGIGHGVETADFGAKGVKLRHGGFPCWSVGASLTELTKPFFLKLQGWQAERPNF